PLCLGNTRADHHGKNKGEHREPFNKSGRGDGQCENFRFRFSLPIYKSSQDPLIPRGVVIQ
ncbi:MAG: hypothetical protein ACK44X_07295, partial [Burkholderiales bacterium]